MEVELQAHTTVESSSDPPEEPVVVEQRPDDLARPESASLANQLATGRFVAVAVFGSWILGYTGSSVLVAALLFLVLWAQFNSHFDLLERMIRDYRNLPKQSLMALEDEEIEKEHDSDAEIKRRVILFCQAGSTHELAVVNAFIANAWPQISLFTERRLRRSLTEALIDRSGKFVRKAELLYTRFFEGHPVFLDWRPYKHGWNDTHKDNLIVEAKVKFSGMLRVGVRLTTAFLGTFNVTIGITDLQVVIRMTFKKRVHSPPFVKFCTIECIDEPKLDFILNIGSFDSSKFHPVEAFVRDKLLRKIRSSVINIVFGKASSNPPPLPPRLKTPIDLDEKIESTKDKDKDVSFAEAPASEPMVSEAEDSPTYKYVSGLVQFAVVKLDRFVPSDSKEVTKSEDADWISSFQVFLEFGKQEFATNANPDATWKDRFCCRFGGRVFTGTPDAVQDIQAKGSKKTASRKTKTVKDEYVVRVRVVEHLRHSENPRKKKQRMYKAQFELVDLIGLSNMILGETTLQYSTLTLDPKPIGNLELKVFWEPLLSPYDYHHEVARYFLSNWSDTGRAPMGILQLQISKLNKDVFSLPLSNPFLMVRFGTEASQAVKDQTYQTHPNNSLVWDEVRSLLCIV
jgi:hypothetical protein